MCNVSIKLLSWINAVVCGFVVIESPVRVEKSIGRHINHGKFDSVWSLLLLCVSDVTLQCASVMSCHSVNALMGSVV